jgi:glycosyltransferase involved in cell wall biosynthesis
MTPRFSILTTAYRTEDYLPGTIASVRAQTFPDWELVVVDNGMSDTIAEIVTREAAEDPRVRLVRQPNRGWAGGVNAAAAAATGEYLCLLDSDDELLPDFCAALDESLAGRPDLDALAVDIERFVDGHEDDTFSGFRTLPRRGAVLRLQDVLAGRVPYTGAVRREVWSALGGLDEGDDVESDILLWARLTGGGRVGVLRRRLARVRERPTSESRDSAGIERFGQRMVTSFRRAADAPSSTSRDRRAAQRAIRTVRYQSALRAGRAAVASGDPHRAREAAREALRQRRTLRALLVRGVVALPPGLTGRLHAAKRSATRRIRANGPDGH